MACHVPRRSAASSGVERRERLLDPAGPATGGGPHPLRRARAQAGYFRGHSGRHGHDWADGRATEDERMRLVAALLVLGSLLVWMLFLQG